MKRILLAYEAKEMCEMRKCIRVHKKNPGHSWNLYLHFCAECIIIRLDVKEGLPLGLLAASESAGRQAQPENTGIVCYERFAAGAEGFPQCFCGVFSSQRYGFTCTDAKAAGRILWIFYLRIRF